MQKYYFTFGFGRSPRGGNLPVGYVVVHAEDAAKAREIMQANYGNKWIHHYRGADAYVVECLDLRLVDELIQADG